MREARFLPYPIHKGEHDRMLADMESRVAEWQKNPDAAALRKWLKHDVGNWFVSHFSTMDFVTARYPKEQGMDRTEGRPKDKPLQTE